MAASHRTRVARAFASTAASAVVLACQFPLLSPPSPLSLLASAALPGGRDCLVEFVQQLQTPLAAAACGPGAEEGFGVECGKCHADPLLDQLVQAHPLGFGEQLQPL